MLRTRYEAYGNTAAGTIPNGIGFTGHVNDADTGLVYMQQRYYDPIAGRFLSTDPVTTDATTGGSFGRYHYALNNPYRVIDPDGRSGEYTEGDCKGRMWGTCQSASGNSGRATAATAGAVLGGTLGGIAAAGCTAGTGGLCAVGGSAIIGGGIATGAIVGNAAFDLVEWMKGLIYTSTGVDSGGGERIRGLPPEGVTPPADGEVKPGPASRPSERDKGGQSLWDDHGGEWRYFPEDKHHNPHWDYNPHNNPSSQWQNIQIGPLPPRK